MAEEQVWSVAVIKFSAAPCALDYDATGQMRATRLLKLVYLAAGYQSKDSAGPRDHRSQRCGWRLDSAFVGKGWWFAAAEMT